MAPTRGAADGGSNSGDGGGVQHRDTGGGNGYALPTQRPQHVLQQCRAPVQVAEAIVLGGHRGSWALPLLTPARVQRSRR
ncbi:hypothetical protein PHYPSEUDO_006860 [Phytophthora pseudosyringae]|uniref:Uncharacterized protein n=1 Tax=Phytophthora pseudosyringae TaxID=221518 RepID=A0A8T1WBV3_9STRA|nr:hypothetical protein PHYPSEUDO_006860 [Phytophthora pseudosyringae]